MRWWFRREPEYFHEEKPKRPRETLSQVSEKLLIKRMKADPEYGITAAEKVKGLSGRGEEKSLKAQLAELKAIRELLKDFGAEGGGERSVLADILKSIVEVASPIIAQGVQEAVQRRQTQSVQQVNNVPTPEITEAPRKQIKEAETSSTRETRELNMVELLPLLNEEPQAGVSKLYSISIEAVSWLSQQTYESIQQHLTNLSTSSPEVKEAVDELLSQRRKPWILSVIAESKAILQQNFQNEVQNEAKNG